MSTTFTGPVPVPSPQSSPLAVLITGASRGIGLELVRQYAAAFPGNVVLAGVRQPTGPSSAALQALASKHRNVHIIELDVSNETSIRDSVKQVQAITDRVDLLINNAGIFGSAQANSTTEATPAGVLEVLNTNLLGVLVTSQVYLPLLRRAASPKVINISSRVGSHTWANRFKTGPAFAYGMSKAALNYLTTAFRYAVPEVAFFSFHPAWVQTDMGNGVGDAPTTVADCVQGIRYYAAEKGIKDSGVFLDVPTGNVIPF